MSETKEQEHQLADGVPVMCCFTEIVDIDTLTENPANPNTHPEKQLQILADTIKRTGWRMPVTISTRSGYIVKGHGRYRAAKLAGLKQVPVERQDYSSPEKEMADLIADNKIAAMAIVDERKLAQELQDIAGKKEETDFGGYTSEEIKELINEEEMQQMHEKWQAGATGISLSDTFLVPPISPIDARTEVWQQRRDAWRHQQETELDGAHVCDPVLTEICLAWYSATGDTVLDPFPIGNVRRIVAEAMGRQYISGTTPEARQQADAILTSFPYGKEKEFAAAIIEACRILKNDCFAIIEVCNTRGKKQALCDNISLTIDTFSQAGLGYSSEIIIETDADSSPEATEKNMQESRIAAEAHRKLLVFIKGSNKKAAQRLGDVKIAEIDTETE